MSDGPQSQGIGCQVGLGHGFPSTGQLLRLLLVPDAETPSFAGSESDRQRKQFSGFHSEAYDDELRAVRHRGQMYLLDDLVGKLGSSSTLK